MASTIVIPTASAIGACAAEVATNLKAAGDPDARVANALIDVATAASSDITALQSGTSSAPGMQVTSGTLVAGTKTISAGIVVAANSEVVPYPDGAITGSTNFGSLQEVRAARAVGGAGVGRITVQAIGADGLIDSDAAGDFHALIFTPHA